MGTSKNSGSEPPFIMQREAELGRVVLAGERTDNGEPGTLLVVRELGGSWVFCSPLGEPGIRISRQDAATLAEELRETTR